MPNPTDHRCSEVTGSRMVGSWGAIRNRRGPDASAPFVALEHPSPAGSPRRNSATKRPLHRPTRQRRRLSRATALRPPPSPGRPGWARVTDDEPGSLAGWRLWARRTQAKAPRPCGTEPGQAEAPRWPGKHTTAPDRSSEHHGVAPTCREAHPSPVMRVGGRCFRPKHEREPSGMCQQCRATRARPERQAPHCGKSSRFQPPPTRKSAAARA